MFLAVFAAATAVIMLLWNALIPSIIGWNAINYWQAAGLLVLCKLLLGGFGKMNFAGMHMMHHNRNKFQEEHPFHYMHDRMEGMSREERREFILRRMKNMEDNIDSKYNTGRKPDNEPEQ